ncbi:hypothetical protein [Coleofasciculus sp.]
MSPLSPHHDFGGKGTKGYVADAVGRLHQLYERNKLGTTVPEYQ